MIVFLEQTWPLWWMLSVVVIVRWFHVASAEDVFDDTRWGARDCQSCSAESTSDQTVLSSSLF